MHLFLLQLLVMLLIQQASASLPSDASLPTSTSDPVYALTPYSDLEYIIPSLCNICNLNINICDCLDRVLDRARVDSWGQFRQQIQSPSPYYVEGTQIDNSGVPATTIPPPGSLDHRYSTIRPEDLVQHEPWPLDKSPNASAVVAMTAAPIQMPVSAAAASDRPLLLPQDIERLSEAGAMQYPASIAQWSTQAYNPGDRLAPPEPVLPPRRREPMQLGGFPCNHSSCSEVFDRKCDLRRHKKKHIPVSDRPHKCSLCDKAFTYPKDRDRHENSHKPRAQTSKIFCPVEGCRSARTGFGRKDNYLRHMRQKHSQSSINTQGS